MKSTTQWQDVEPLSTASWLRIEQGVFAALDTGPLLQPAPPRRAQRWLAVTATLAAAAAVLWISSRGGPGDNLRSSAATGDRGARVEVGDVALDLAPNSALTTHKRASGDIVVALERGTVRCSVAPRRGRPPVTVRAGEVVVRVVGTEFAVTRSGEGASVEVYEGVVEVTSGGDTVRIPAGERWPAPVVFEPEPEPAPELVFEPDPEPAPELVFEPDPEPAPELGPGDPVEARRRHSKRRPPRVTRPAAPDAAEAADPVPTPSTRYATAQALEPSDPDGAAAIYRELAAGTDAWAANALYAHALLARERGQTARASRLLRAYVRRFPRGVNAPDARRELERMP